MRTESNKLKLPVINDYSVFAYICINGKRMRCTLQPTNTFKVVINSKMKSIAPHGAR